MRKRLVILAVAVLLIGCKTQSVVLPQSHDSIVVKTETRYDSIFIDRWHERAIKADTIFVRDSVYVEKLKTIFKADTIRTRDSVPYAVPEYIKMRERNGYDRFVSWGFWILAVLLILRIVIRIYFRR